MEFINLQCLISFCLIRNLPFVWHMVQTHLMLFKWDFFPFQIPDLNWFFPV